MVTAMSEVTKTKSEPRGMTNDSPFHTTALTPKLYRLELIRTLSEKMARSRGLDITVSATTDRAAALDGCDAVLSSFRPGGFAARVHDERIPLDHGTIGQETQGAGGFFMALRAIHVLKEVCAEMERICPDAWIFNYTNPVNIVAEAVTHNSPLKIVSLCEGPIYFRNEIAESAGLEPERLRATMVGLNHGCWSVEASYDGADPFPLLEEAWERRRDDQSLDGQRRRQLELAARMGSIPADYFMYYYFRDEILAEARAKPTTRAEDIMAWAPGYWAHYQEQARLDDPQLDPALSRGGIHELELAIDVMDAIFNDKDEIHPVNMPNRGGALPGFPDDLVVEVEGRCHGGGIDVLPAKPLPRHVRGLVEMLGEYQALAAEAAWNGTRKDAVRALYANPLVLNVDLAERVYAALAEAHRAYLPERLLAA